MLLNLVLLKISLLLGCVYCDVIHDIPNPIPCDQSLCPPGTKHIGCVDHMEISADCGSNDVKILSVSRPMSVHIVEHVNALRNMVASGFLNMSAAARMPAMTWNTQLAYGSAILARQCDREAYFCSNTQKFHYVASVELSSKANDSHNPHKLVMTQLLPVWLNDVVGCRMDEKNVIIPIAPGMCVGHYIPVIQDYGNRIGCTLRVVRLRYGTFEVALVCLFSRAAIIGMPPYEVGRKPGEKCLTGKHSLYPYLCSPDEKIDNNYVKVDNDYDREPDDDDMEECPSLREFLKEHLEITEY